MFKFSHLFQKKKLLLFNLSLLFFTNEATPISTTSSKNIEGSAPYLIFDEQKSDDLSPLLTVKLPLAPNGVITTITKKTVSSVQKPIILASNTKFSNIETFVKLPSENNKYPKIQLSDVLANSWGDKDGDVVKSISSEEFLTLSWSDNEGHSLTEKIKKNPNMELEPCDAPFKLTLSADQFTLSTEYGVPRDSNYQSVAHDYYFSPQVPLAVKFCYAQPNLNNQDDVDTDSWIKNKGFVTYDKNNPENNFPTTGSNNLFFDLKLAGLTVDDIIRINGTNVTPISGNGISLALSKKDGKLRVTLKGPTYTSTNTSFEPATFKLYADSAKNTAFYSFKIQRWYIGFENASNGYAETLTRCQKLKYAIPDIRDFTNSNRLTSVGWNGGIPGVGEPYRRKISYKQNDGKWMGGLFSEWGTVYNSYYENSDWPKDTKNEFKVPYFWTKQLRSTNDYFVVESKTGFVGNRQSSEQNYNTACVSSGN